METNTFQGYNSAVLAWYSINATNATDADTNADSNAATPSNVAQMIYAASQEGVPTVFLQSHQGESGRGSHIAILHSVYNYVLRMGLPDPPWDDDSFSSKGEICCGTISCVNWLLASLHQIGSMVYLPTDLAIDTTIAADPDADLLGNFTSMYTNVEPLCIRNNIYLSAPFIEIFLERYLTPMEACNSLRGAIFDGVLEVNFCPVIGTLKTGDEIAFGHVALQRAAGRWRRPLALASHAHTPPPWDGT